MLSDWRKCWSIHAQNLLSSKKAVAWCALKADFHQMFSLHTLHNFLFKTSLVSLLVCFFKVMVSPDTKAKQRLVTDRATMAMTVVPLHYLPGSMNHSFTVTMPLAPKQ